MIHNARIKLSADWLSNIGVGLFVVGSVTPLVQGHVSFANVIFATIAGGIGRMLHVLARDSLGALQ